MKLGYKYEIKYAGFFFLFASLFYLYGRWTDQIRGGISDQEIIWMRVDQERMLSAPLVSI